MESKRKNIRYKVKGLHKEVRIKYGEPEDHIREKGIEGIGRTRFNCFRMEHEIGVSSFDSNR